MAMETGIPIALNSPNYAGPRVVVWNDDLIFYSRIDGRARAAGCKAVQARNADQAIHLATDSNTLIVLVDIQLAGAEISSLTAALGTLPSRPRIVGYGSHVEAQALRAAREAGCDLVLPRSRFVEDLVSCWDAWITKPGTSPE